MLGESITKIWLRLSLHQGQYHITFCLRLHSKVIEAEPLWSKFVATHNLPFQTSDHATKLFKRKFPDSEVAKLFACGHTKTAAIILALAPNYLENTLSELTDFFSVMMDELNDKVDKSYIILAHLLDSRVGDIRTRFLDMPIVNIGTAQNLFQNSLISKGLSVYLSCPTLQM